MIKVGTIIVCPRKNHAIGMINKLMPIPTVAHIDYEPGQERVAGDPACCVICNSAFIVSNNIHTDAGWLPDDPVIEPVS